MGQEKRRDAEAKEQARPQGGGVIPEPGALVLVVCRKAQEATLGNSHPSLSPCLLRGEGRRGRTQNPGGAIQTTRGQMQPLALGPGCHTDVRVRAAGPWSPFPQVSTQPETQIKTF